MFNSLYQILIFFVDILVYIGLIGMCIPFFLFFMPRRYKEFNLEEESKVLQYKGFGNCCIWALQMLRKYGGYICIRPSIYWRGAHVVWMPFDKSAVYSFKPIFCSDHQVRWWEFHMLIWFRGYIKKHDNFKYPIF